MSDDDLEFEQSPRKGLGGLGSQRSPCPTAEEISSYMSIELPVDRLVEIRAHIRLCGSCDGQLQRLAEGGLRPLWQRLVLHPVAGYGLALGLLLWIVAEPNPVSPTPPLISAELASVKTIDLNTVRSERRPIVIGPGDQAVLLGFFVPVTPDRTYTAALDGSPPRVIQSYDGRGNFHLLCDRSLFSPGAHRLVVREGEAGAEFEFEFTLP